MKSGQIKAPRWATDLPAAWSDEHIKIVFDHFADQIDNQIQNQLVSQLAVRYAEVSQQLEIKNRQLLRSDASRREAQVIALLGNWELNLRTKKLWWSDTMQEVLEIENPTDTDADLQVYFRRVHPDDLARNIQIAEDVFKGIAPAESQHRMVMDNGRIKWVHIRYVMSYDAKGKPLLVRGTIQDITAAKEAEEKLRIYNDHLEELVRQKVAEISASQMATLYALVKLAESRDDETGEHIGRTSEYCRLAATKLWQREAHPEKINASFIENITKASPLHDIGKVGIPDRILLKPGKLTPEEFEIMKTHTLIGYETLAGVEKEYKMNAFIRTGMEIALCHHEKWDGSGYPNGLKGKEIPIAARIMALADVYDALRSRRVYKEGFSHEKSAAIIEQGSGSHFDPLLVEIFLENQQEFRRIFDNSL